MKSQILTFVALFTLLQTIAVGAERQDTAEKRAWLQRQVIGQVRNRGQQREMRAQLDRMSPEQVDESFSFYQRKLAAAQLDLQRAQARRQQLQQQLYQQRGGVGYAPVITWLPQGTNMTASAVVSPDRRYVRVSPQPFFSSIPYYDTYNLQTGRTQRYLPNGTTYAPQSSPYVAQPQSPPVVQPQTATPKVQYYYDGIRTRVRRVP